MWAQFNNDEANAMIYLMMKIFATAYIFIDKAT